MPSRCKSCRYKGDCNLDHRKCGGPFIENHPKQNLRERQEPLPIPKMPR